MSVAMPRDLVHLVPVRCQVPAPGWLRPWPPNSQTLPRAERHDAGELAARPQPPLGTIFQAEPFQCSTLPFR